MISHIGMQLIIINFSLLVRVIESVDLQHFNHLRLSFIRPTSIRQHHQTKLTSLHRKQKTKFALHKNDSTNELPKKKRSLASLRDRSLCCKESSDNELNDIETDKNKGFLLSRHQMLTQSASLLLIGVVLSKPQISYGSVINSTSPSQQHQQSIDPIDIKKVMEENKINVTITDTKTKSQIYINQTSFDKMSVPSTSSSSTSNTSLPLPSWIRQTFFQMKQKQHPQMVESIPDSKLFLASIIAGSVTEIVRTVVLYPITTIKSRAQYKPPSTSSIGMVLNIKSPWMNDQTFRMGGVNGQVEYDTNQTLILNTEEYDRNSTTMCTTNQTDKIHINETAMTSAIAVPIENDDTPLQSKRMSNLYSGILPQLIATVPACGIYFAVRDVTKREFTKTLDFSSSIVTTTATTTTTTSSYSFPLSSFLKIDDLSLTLFSVFLADVFSLAIKTPALTLSTRKQIETVIDEDHEVDDHDTLSSSPSPSPSTLSSSISTMKTSTITLFQETRQKLPIIILTDLPYLFLKITLLRFITTGNENIAQYTLLNTILSCICAGITTPFDVARTRILVDSNGDPSDGLDGGLIMLKDDDNNEGYMERRERGGSWKNIMDTMKMVMNETKDYDYYVIVDDKDEIGDDDVRVAPTISSSSSSGSGRRNGYQNLFAGWYERVLYLGLSVAWFDSVRILGYVGIRDYLLLEVFR